MQIEAHGVFVQDVNRPNIFHCATRKLVADGGVFDAQDIQLHCFRIDLTTVVKQYALAQTKYPGGEFLVGLPALGNAGDNIAVLIDISQASVHRRDWMGVILRMSM